MNTQKILDALAVTHAAVAAGNRKAAEKHLKEVAALVRAEAAVELDDKFAAKVGGPMRRTWDAIASDASQLEGRITESGARELVLDANRMATYGGAWGAEADRLVGAACEQHGYEKVGKFLGRKVKLL